MKVIKNGVIPGKLVIKINPMLHNNMFVTEMAMTWGNDLFLEC